MNNPLFWILVVLLASLIAWGVVDSRRLYRFTVFFSVSFFGFVVPQLNGLANENGVLFANMLPEGALDQLTLVCVLCVLGMWLGDNRGVNHPGVAKLIRFDEYDNRRLVRVAVGLTLIGVIISQVAINALDADYLANLGSQFSGPITIFLFFQSMQKYGLAVSILVYLRTRSPAAFLCALFNVLTNVVSFTQISRRGAMADTVFMVILGLYFGRRIVLPAWLLGVLFVVGTLWSHAIGEFRGNQDLTFWQKLEKAEFLGDFGHTWNNGGDELFNAAIICWSVEELNEYDFGKVHWNQLVHGYFPGQIFGNELKKAIKFPETDVAWEARSFKPAVGTTTTGMADAFRSFWYFGCIKYYIIGYVMGRWWNRANRGDLRAQLIYMAIMASALHTITHGTWWLMNAYLHIVIFAYPCLYWARHHLIGLEPPQQRAQPQPMLTG
jgi:hypothetical protein